MMASGQGPAVPPRSPIPAARGAVSRARDFSIQRTMQGLEAVYGELLPVGG